MLCGHRRARPAADRHRRPPYRRPGTGSSLTPPPRSPRPTSGWTAPSTDALVRSRRFFTRGTVSDDLRTLSKTGGREADDFYRDRWSHDKVVRSTHGVNCTGSCSWKVYVKDGIITWETQQTDYPSVGPDSPEYEPRGCPRGAAFSWYTYSPTRVRYPYVRGVLLQMFREAKAQHDGDPVRAWEHIVENPLRAKAYKSARGKGGLVRATWEEASRDRRRRARPHDQEVRPRPGRRLLAHPGDVDGLARLRRPVREPHRRLDAELLRLVRRPARSPRPQVFGDQTDVPESGDWWNAGYLIMWGSNLPVTRTPDAHWMTEARYRGQKVIAVAPDYADNVKFADEWLPAKPGTDAALAMAMGHVVLKEFFVDRQTPYFTEYVKTYTDLPYLVRLEEAGDGEYTAGKFLTAADLAEPRGRGERRLQDRAHRRADRRAGGPERLPGPPLRRGRRGQVEPRARRRRPASSRCSTPPTESVVVRMPRFDTPDGAAADLPRGVPGAPRRRPPGHHGLRPAAGAVRRGPRRPAGRVGRRRTTTRSRRTPRPGRRRSPACPPSTAARIGREFAAERRGVQGPLDDRDGRRHQPLVPLRHDLPRLPHPDQPDRLPGRQRRRLGALRRPGEGPADHRLHPDRQRAGLEPAAAQHDPDRVLVPAHQPVPLRPVRRRHPVRHHRQGPARRASPPPT